MSVTATRTIVSDSETGRSRLVYGDPSPALRALVRPYCAYEERNAARIRRREPAVPFIPIIINLGPTLRVSEFAGDETLVPFQMPFVAGMHCGHSIVESDGHQYGIQVDISPIGARLLFGVSMHELANRIVSLEAILGSAGRVLIERLREAPDAENAFGIIDDAILARIERAEEPCEATAWAWTTIVKSGGNVDIAAMATDLGWSQRHLIARFRDQLGLPPKVLARVVRFSRARVLLERHATCGSVADVAERCGYYDQSHLIRDFRQFAGITPREYLAHRLRDGHGIAAP